MANHHKNIENIANVVEYIRNVDPELLRDSDQESACSQNGHRRAT